MRSPDAAANAWDDDLADDLFAANVFADEDRDRRRSQASSLQERCGPLVAGELQATSATAAAFDLHGQRGDVRVSLSLNPEVPPRVQWYEIAPQATGRACRPGGWWKGERLIQRAGGAGGTEQTGGRP